MNFLKQRRFLQRIIAIRLVSSLSKPMEDIARKSKVNPPRSYET